MLAQFVNSGTARRNGWPECRWGRPVWGGRSWRRIRRRLCADGKYYFINGDRYEGTFSNGINNGYGIFYSTLGIKLESYFKRDIFYSILFIIYKILLFLNHLRDIFIKNKITLLLIIILIIRIILN